MRHGSKPRKTKKEAETTRTLDYFDPEPTISKVETVITAPKKMKIPRAVQNTVQWYREVYYLNDLRTLVHVFRKSFPNMNHYKFKSGINFLLFGKNRDGTIRTEPLMPNPSLMTTNIGLYRFQEKVYNAYWNPKGHIRS